MSDTMKLFGVKPNIETVLLGDAAITPAAAQEPEPIERCECGYPMPCSKTVPIGFCRAPLRDFTRAAAALAPTAQGE